MSLRDELDKLDPIVDSVPLFIGGHPFFDYTVSDLKAALALQPEVEPITQNDKRWRLLEHGCQWVSWCPTGGRVVSFDPRNVTGFSGDLNDMRGQADIEIRKQFAVLEKGIKALQSPKERSR